MPPKNTAAARKRGKDIVLRMLRAFNEGDMDTVAKLIAPDARSGPSHPLSPEVDALPIVQRVQREIRHKMEAMPNGVYEVEKVLAEVTDAGTEVVIRWRFKGRHTGPMLGIAATNREVNVVGHEFVTVEGGRIRIHIDDHPNTLLSVLGQTGALSNPNVRGRLGFPEG